MSDRPAMTDARKLDHVEIQINSQIRLAIREFVELSRRLDQQMVQFKELLMTGINPAEVGSVASLGQLGMGLDIALAQLKAAIKIARECNVRDDVASTIAEAAMLLSGGSRPIEPQPYRTLKHIANVQELLAMPAESVVVGDNCASGEAIAYQRRKNGQWYTYDIDSEGISSKELNYSTSDLSLIYIGEVPVMANMVQIEHVWEIMQQNGWCRIDSKQGTMKLKRDGVEVELRYSDAGRITKAKRVSQYESEIDVRKDKYATVLSWLQESSPNNPMR